MTGTSSVQPGSSAELLGEWLRRQAPVLYLLVDPDGTVVETNPFTRELLGEALLARGTDGILLSFGDPLELATLRQRPDTPHLLSVSTAKGLPESLQLWFQPRGARTLILGAADLAEASHVRAELLKLNNELSTLTREVQRKSAELARLNELKTRFLGMAAHDLRKPVSAILSYVEFLIDEAQDRLDEEHFGFLKTIRRSTDSMKDIIDSFLDATLIESGRFAVALRPGQVEPAVRQSVDLLMLPARSRGVSLELQVASPLPTVHLDSPKLEQVLANLLSNAIEHSEADTTVRVEVAAEPGGVCIAVQDQGPGIAAELQGRLFELFGSGRAEQRRVRQGMGLGLAISKKIVEAHQGTIDVSSEPGCGARFAVHLPESAP